jgi:proteasome assembly chaperone (PAC2) family protein
MASFGAIQAAALLAVKLGSFYDHKAAPAVLQALLKVAHGGCDV